MGLRYSALLPLPLSPGKAPVGDAGQQWRWHHIARDAQAAAESPRDSRGGRHLLATSGGAAGRRRGNDEGGCGGKQQHRQQQHQRCYIYSWCSQEGGSTEDPILRLVSIEEGGISEDTEEHKNSVN